MFLFRKNIILVPVDYDGLSVTKGLVSLDCHDNKINGTLHCYNLVATSPLKLGIAINNNLHKISILPSDVKNFEFKIDDKIKNGDDVSCVLLDVGKTDYKVELWGSTQITSGWQTSLALMLQDENLQKNEQNTQNFEKNDKNLPKTEQFLQNNVPQNQTESDNYFGNFKSKKPANQSVFDGNNANLQGTKLKQLAVDEHFDYASGLNGADHFKNDFCDVENKNLQTDSNANNFDDTQQNSQNIAGQGAQCCAQNSTKNNAQFCNQNQFLNKGEQDDGVFAYSQANLDNFIDKVIDLTDDDADAEPKKDVEPTFAQRLGPQIEKLFASNKTEKVLTEIIPNSKFCRVDFDDKSGYYVFGIIYDNQQPKYLCYGVPAKKDSTPPAEFFNLYQWLPIDAQNEYGDGFYMMYQDATTGQNISVDII